MRPPTRNDGPVPTLRKHPPPPHPPSTTQSHPTANASSASASSEQLSLSTLTTNPAANLSADPVATASSDDSTTTSSSSSSSSNSHNSATTTANNFDRGRRAFFNVESDRLLFCSPHPTTGSDDAAAGTVPASGSGLQPYEVVSYERRRRNRCERRRRNSDSDDFSPQVSFGSESLLDLADDDDDNNDDISIKYSAYNVDGGAANYAAKVIPCDDSSSANNSCALSAPGFGPAQSAAVWFGNGSDNDCDRSVELRPLDSVSHSSADRVALVKNSASLIFTKKVGSNSVQPAAAAVVHRRQRDIRSAFGKYQRRSLHDQQHRGLLAEKAKPATGTRNERAYSWYAPSYKPLCEESENQRLLQVN